jgi:hypothetical protein
MDTSRTVRQSQNGDFERADTHRDDWKRLPFRQVARAFAAILIVAVAAQAL